MGETFSAKATTIIIKLERNNGSREEESELLVFQFAAL
jgi:hypothetical protein